MGASTYRRHSGDKQHYALSLVAENETPQLIGLNFFAHGIHQHPQNHHRVMCFEKKGRGAALVDLPNKRMLHNIAPSTGRHFYGHGSFSPTGDIIYVTETDLSQRNGVISVRDGQNGQLLGEFPSYGSNPHDCQLIDSGQTLVITNAGDPLGGEHAPCVSYIDVNSQTLIERWEPSSKRINTGHLLHSKHGLAVASAPRDGLAMDELGGISFRPALQGELQTRQQPASLTERLYGETLSLALHPDTGIIGITTPDANVVSFWQLSTGDFIHSVDLPAPRGIAYDQRRKHFMVSFGEQASMVAIDGKTLQEIPSSLIHRRYITGSHLYAWHGALNTT